MEDFNPVLEGPFHLDSDKSNSLGGIKNQDNIMLRNVLTEDQIGQTSYRVKFHQVQFGTFNDQPACLIVMEATFHCTNHRDYRFKAATLELDFRDERNSEGGGGGVVDVKAFAPRLLFGKAREEEDTWSWEIGASTNLNIPPASIELGNFKIANERKYPIIHMLRLQGSVHGTHRADRIIWSVEERKQDGIPLQLPLLSVIVTHARDQILWANFKVSVDTGWSMNPRRWPLLPRRDDPLRFHERYPIGKEVDKELEKLNLGAYVDLSLPQETIDGNLGVYDTTPNAVPR